MQAADMFRRGKRQVDVAAKLGVSQPTASRWYRMWLTGGRATLAGAGRAGRRPKLSDEQLAEVEAALVKGPKANGYPTEMWTLARVAEVIERVTGVRHGTTHKRAQSLTKGSEVEVIWLTRTAVRRRGPTSPPPIPGRGIPSESWTLCPAMSG